MGQFSEKYQKWILCRYLDFSLWSSLLSSTSFCAFWMPWLPQTPAPSLKFMETIELFLILHACTETPPRIKLGLSWCLLCLFSICQGILPLIILYCLLSNALKGLKKYFVHFFVFGGRVNLSLLLYFFFLEVKLESIFVFEK